MSTIEERLSRGEIVHPDADWDALDAEYARCTTHAAKMTFFAEKLAGSAAIGCVVEGPRAADRLKEAQRCIDAIFDAPANLNKTGAELGLLGTPGVLCSSPQKFVVANSSVLTPADLKTVAATTRAFGPAEFAMLFMPRETKDGGFASVHFEGPILPKDPRDGQPLLHAVHWAYTANENPLARKYITEKYKVSSLGVGPLTSRYGLMLSSREGEIKNGRPSILLALREKDWHLTMSEVLAHEKAGHDDPSLRESYGRIINPIHGIALWPDITTEQHSEMLQVEALFEAALERGEVLRHGRLTPCNSCGAFPSALLALALPEHEFSQLDAGATPLDQLAVKLMAAAPKHLWVKEGVKAFIYDITPDKRAEVYEEISREEAVERTRRIVTHPEMFKKQPIAGFASWGNQYTTFQQPHPNPKARGLYEEAFLVLVEELKRIAEE